MILVILQNAWFEDGKKRRREQWEIGLSRSHTGRRLSEMIPTDTQYTVINSTPEVGDWVGSRLEPNEAHIRFWIEQTQPDKILACGKVAQGILEKMDTEFIEAPHPAWRQLSKNHTREIRAILEEV